MAQWYEQPEDSQELQLFTAPKYRPWWRAAIVWAVCYAVLAGAVLLVAMLAGCASYQGPWRATFEVRYANGKLITSGHAGEGNPRAHGSNPRADEATQRTQGASAPDSFGDRR